METLVVQLMDAIDANNIGQVSRLGRLVDEKARDYAAYFCLRNSGIMQLYTTLVNIGVSKDRVARIIGADPMTTVHMKTYREHIDEPVNPADHAWDSVWGNESEDSWVKTTRISKDLISRATDCGIDPNTIRDAAFEEFDRNAGSLQILNQFPIPQPKLMELLMKSITRGVMMGIWMCLKKGIQLNADIYDHIATMSEPTKRELAVRMLLMHDVVPRESLVNWSKKDKKWIRKLMAEWHLAFANV